MAIRSFLCFDTEVFYEGTAPRRFPAANVMAEVAAGKTKFAIFESYSSLPLDGIEACIQ
jgi:hypothetical protein